jgi:4-amino-4-deoxy-L-arabinose transferase-like glycosyltransferase
LRLLFAAGINDQTDLINMARVAKSASYFTDGSRDFGSAYLLVRNELGGIRNFIFYIPDLFFYLILGITRVSGLALSMAFSLASIVLIYAIGFIQTNKRVVGLLAALIMAFFPLDIFYSTAAPRVSPMTFLFLLFVFCLLLVVKKSSKWAMGFGSLILISFFLWQPQLLAVALTIALAAYFYINPQRRPLIFFLWTIIGLVLLLGWQQTGATFLSFYSLILGQPEMVIFLPLFVVAILVLTLKREKSTEAPILGSLIVLCVYIGLGIFLNSDEKPDLFGAGIFLQPFFAFLAITLAIYFSSDLSQRQGIIWTCALVVIAATGAGLAVIGSSDFLPSFQGLDWLGLHSLFLIYSILGGIAFAGVIVSPFFMTGTKGHWRTAPRFALLAIILLSTLSFSWNRANDYRYLTIAPARALAYISNNGISLPIYAVSEDTYDRLGYLAKMVDIVGENDLQINLTSMEETDQIQEGLILVFDDNLTAPPPGSWRQVGAFGNLGEPRLVIYEVRSIQKANVLLKANRVGVNPLDIYGLLINAGLLCEGYQTWRSSPQTEWSTSYFIPYSVQSDCVVRGDNLVSIEDLTNRNNLQGYIYFPSSSEGLDTLDMAQVTLPIFDMRTSSVAVELKPNSLYLYSIDVKTTSPTVALFWHVGDAEDYLEMRPYPEWETVSALIRTPDWGSPEDVSFSPVLFDHLEIVSVRNFFIGPVELTATQP